jgi:DNA-binding HxlR family transcriptional regulator
MAGRPVRGVSADQLLQVLLDDRAKSVVATLGRANSPLTMTQLRRRLPGAAMRTLRLILEHGEAEGHIRRIRLRGVDRWAASDR